MKEKQKKKVRQGQAFGQHFTKVKDSGTLTAVDYEEEPLQVSHRGAGTWALREEAKI